MDEGGIFGCQRLAKPPIDSNASNDDNMRMSTTLTIRNLDEAVKQRLRMRAAYNKRSMEAEAREILATSLADGVESLVDKETAIAARMKRIESVVGIWKDQMNGKTTDEIMQELRGDD